MVENIATDLREAGVRPQTPCAFVLDNCIEAVVYFLAVQWIGAIAVPIDPALSAQTIASVLKEVNATTVVSAFVDEDEQKDDEMFLKMNQVSSTQNIIHWYISRSMNKGVYLEMYKRRAGEGAAWAGGAADFKYDPTETCVRIASGDHQHLLVYDISHRRVAEATREFAKMYSLIAEQTTLLISPFYSMDGLMCVLATMYSGGNVVISQNIASDPQRLLKNAKDIGVNWFSANSDTILTVFEKAKNDPSLLNGLKISFIRSFAGNIDEATLAEIEAIFHAPVFEAYGSPETCSLVSANVEGQSRAGTCGKAVSGCDIGIFDRKTNQLLSADSEGKIGVLTSDSGKGYINNDYANKSCFIDVSKEGLNKVYFLTGDTGLLSTDGYLAVTSHGEPKKKAATLAAQEESEIKSMRDMAKLEAMRVAADAQKEEAEARRLKEEAQRAVEEETRKEEDRLQEEARKLEEQRIKEEENSRKSQEDSGLDEKTTSSGKYFSSEEGTAVDTSEGMQTAESYSSEESSSDQTVSSRTGRYSTRAEREAAEEEIMNKIMQRIDQIERNQMRLEEEIEGRHTLEMMRMRELIEKMEEDSRTAAPTSMAVNMDEINSAVNKAAASAESSSRDTAAAAKAAKEAAAAAIAASALKENLGEGVVEVKDPNCLQKTVLVSLEEVEQAVRMHPAVECARAFGRPDARYGVEVFCAINAKKGARVSEPWLKLHAQSYLKAAFVPKRFYYKKDLSEDEDREALSKNSELKRISEISGYNVSKVIRRPSWNPQAVS